VFLNRVDQVGRLAKLQVTLIFLSLCCEHLGDSLTGPDAADESLKLDEALQATVELRTVVVLLIVVTHPVLLHQSSLLLELVLGGIRPHIVLRRLSVRVPAFAIGR